MFNFKIFIFFLVLIGRMAFGQVVLNETFSNFFPDTTESNIDLIYGCIKSGCIDSLEDHSANNADMSIFSGQYTDGVEQASILIQDGYCIDFNNNGTYTLVNNGILQTTGSISVACVLRLSSVSGFQYAVTHDNSSSLRHWNLYLNNATLRFQVWGATNAYRPQASLTTDTWYMFVGIYNTTGPALDLYVNGVASTQSVSGTIPASLNSIAERMNISGIAGGTTDIDADISLVALYDGALGAKQAKEMGFLAANWNSENGGVTRDLASQPWAQGIVADTVFTSIGTTGTASGHIDAWGASGGETLYIFNKAGDAQTITNLSTLSQRFNIYSIDFAPSDSIYFYSPGTIYIDNVYLEMGENSPNIYTNQFTGFPEFPDFLNDEAIQ